MNIGFLIITFGNNYLDGCINSIKKYYPHINIYVVDNNINSNVKIIKDNVYYSKNNINSFELGAIWYGVKKWPEVDKFIILHNSMSLIDKLPDFVFEDGFVPFWRASSADYSPVVPIVKKKLKSINLTLDEQRDTWESICGCCCSIETINLKNLIKLNCDKLYATKKDEAVSTEILFGYLINKILKLKYQNELYDHPIYEHWVKGKPYKNVKKIGQGQGNILLTTIKLPVKISKIILPHFNKKKSKNDNFISLLKFINNNEEIQKFLLQHGANNIETGNCMVNSLIMSVKHRMYTKKYFPDYYEEEYKQIINKKKIIFN